MTRAAEVDIVVDVPVEVVYRAWSDFESYPRFMSRVRQVRRTDEGGRRLHWVTTGEDGPPEWDAEVYDLTANRRIGWRSISGARDDGAVVLESEGERTRVTLRREFEPPDDIDPARAERLVAARERTLRQDLVNFKLLVETGQGPANGWPWPVWAGLGLAAAALAAGTGLGIWYGRSQTGAAGGGARPAARAPRGRPVRRAAGAARRTLREAAAGAARGARSERARRIASWITRRFVVIGVGRRLASD
jgi:uncharacterized protein YndB with AHSA1/START domain